MTTCRTKLGPLSSRISSIFPTIQAKQSGRSLLHNRGAPSSLGRLTGRRGYPARQCPPGRERRVKGDGVGRIPVWIRRQRVSESRFDWPACDLCKTMFRPGSPCSACQVISHHDLPSAEDQPRNGAGRPGLYRLPDGPDGLFGVSAASGG